MSRSYAPFGCASPRTPGGALLAEERHHDDEQPGLVGASARGGGGGGRAASLASGLIREGESEGGRANGRGVMGCQLGDATTPARSATWGGGRPACGLACFFRPLGRNPKKLRARGDDGGRARGARRAREPPRAARGVPGATARTRRARGRAVARSSGRAVARVRRPARGAETIDRTAGSFAAVVYGDVSRFNTHLRRRSLGVRPRAARDPAGVDAARAGSRARGRASREPAPKLASRVVQQCRARSVTATKSRTLRERVFFLSSFSHGGRLRGAGLRGHERAPKPVEPVGEEND